MVRLNPGLGAVLWALLLPRTVATASRPPSCNASLSVVHWTHLPKAGGTAMASLARRVACAKNPSLATWYPPGAAGPAHLNPCCVPRLCVSEISCHASSSTCPLVTGIGRHTSSMSFLVDMPCCAREWFAKTRTSFFRSALRPPMSAAELDRRSVGRVGGRWAQVDTEGNATFATGGGSGALSRMRSYDTWPLASRVAFFARVGMTPDAIERRIVDTGVLADDARARRALVALARREFVATPRLESFPENTAFCHRAARAIWSEAGAEQPREWPLESEDAMALAQARRERPCCAGRTPGDASMTLVRHPFTRAASAYFYRGHSPNNDLYGLRPGVFTGSAERYERRGSRAPPRRFTFREMSEAEEYRDVATKMFGDPNGCEKARRCRGRSNCVTLTACHVYHNASSYLGSAHVDAAYRALERHAFFGLLEAYNGSARLALETFDVPPGKNDFAPSRGSVSLGQKCSGATALRLDARACRGFFELNANDFALYERVQRLFCRRLGAAGLAARPDVAAELARHGLCGATDFSDADGVCGPLEAPDVLAKLADLQAQCGANKVRKSWDWGF